MHGAQGGRRIRLALVAGLVLASPLRAQQPAASGPPAATPAPRLLFPGDPQIRGITVRSGTVAYTLTLYQLDDEIPVGRITESFDVDSSGSTPIGRRIQRVQRGTALLVDTLLVDLATLAPRARRGTQPSRGIRLDFDGRRVRGAVMPYDAPPVPLDTVLPAVVFDAGSWDLVLRALPLAPGLSIRLPVYDVDGGLRDYRLAVTGTATVQGEEAHVVLLTLARNRESVVWVSRSSGQILQIETPLGDTMLLRQQRVAGSTPSPTPLPIVSGARSPRSR